MSAPTMSIATEYLMTLHAPIAGVPQRIDEALTIFHSDSGTVEGPRIKGRILAPTERSGDASSPSGPDGNGRSLPCFRR